MIKRRHPGRLTFVLLALACICATSLSAESARGAKPRVAVFGFLNLTGDDSFDVPAETAGDNLYWGISLLGTHEATMPASIPRSYGNDSLSRWCDANGIDTILFGTVVAGSSGSQEYTLSVYDNAKKSITIRKTATGSSVLDVFGISDDLTAAVLSAIAGHHVGFGSIAFVNSGGTQNIFAVIDNGLRVDNPSMVERVVAGTHRVRVIAKTPEGDDDLFVGDVAVTEGKTATVTVTARKGAGSATAPARSSRSSSLHDELALIDPRAGGDYWQQIEDSTGFSHKITPFLIGKYEVPYSLWYAVLQWASDPARGERRYTFVHKGFENPYTGIEGTAPSEEGSYPVSGVNWLDCVVWCNAYSEMQGLRPCYYQDGKFAKVIRSATNEIDSTKTDTRRRIIDIGHVYLDVTAKGYRLPTEGEWLYAASCGGEYPATRASGVTYSDEDNTRTSIADVAWFVENSGVKPHPGGQKAANKFGLYDMSGNVMEWCHDWYGNLPEKDVVDYQGPATGTKRVLHGGSYMTGEDDLRLGKRFNDDQDANQLVYGFRVVRRQ